jgi:DNA repair protein RecO (recombination protein O)
MIENARGLVLRTRLLTETSLIVHWLTPQLGRLATVAKGARRSQSPFQGKLDLGYLLEFSFSRSRRSDLHTLREIRLVETHAPLRKDVGYLQQLAYCTALIELTTETETPLPAIYELLRGWLQHLGATPPQPLTIFAFELKLLNELGLAPDLAETRLQAGTKQLLAKLASADWPFLNQLRTSPAQLTELRQFLHGFLIFHLGKIPAARGPALQLRS